MSSGQSPVPGMNITNFRVLPDSCLCMLFLFQTCSQVILGPVRVIHICPPYSIPLLLDPNPGLAICILCHLPLLFLFVC